MADFDRTTRTQRAAGWTGLPCQLSGCTRARGHDGLHDPGSLPAFMADAVNRGLSKLTAISQAAGYLRGTPLTVRDLGSAYDRAKTAKEDPR